MSTRRMRKPGFLARRSWQPEFNCKTLCEVQSKRLDGDPIENALIEKELSWIELSISSLSESSTQQAGLSYLFQKYSKQN